MLQEEEEEIPELESGPGDISVHIDTPDVLLCIGSSV
jgi:hypothetical protein